MFADTENLYNSPPPSFFVPAPNEYNVVDSQVNARILTPATACFKSKVAILHGINQHTKQSSSTPGPCFYSPKSDIVCMSEREKKISGRAKILKIRNWPLPTKPKHEIPNFILHGINQQTKNASSTPGPCFYNPLSTIVCMSESEMKISDRAKILQIRNMPLPTKSKHKFPSPGQYNITKIPTYYNKFQNPSWFFQGNEKKECEEMLKMWKLLHKRSPGPADHQVLLPKHKSFNFKQKVFISRV